MSCEKIIESLQMFTHDGSGWVEGYINKLKINIIKCRPCFKNYLK